MKTNVTRFLSALLFTVLMLNAVSMAFGADPKKETRKVGDFNKISLAISANLYLTQGTACEVIIEADEDILNKIETEVENGYLKIEFEKWYNYRGNKDINVYVTIKDVNSLMVTGSGDIINKTSINAEKLEMVVTGSGSILINDLKVKEIDAMISGSGDIEIAGNQKADELDATITGSGDIESSNIEFSEADLTITGSGSIHAFVSKELEATITGSGKILYKGQPIVDANITGSGKIRKE
ncbi:MAG TPA: head GIN domain-containing protein [Bacteroidales bacterium]|nr:head GIN domain-containing protein [Bacteroidales bacterium]